MTDLRLSVWHCKLSGVYFYVGNVPSTVSNKIGAIL